MRNFPIDWIIKMDLPELYERRRSTYTGYTIDCPFCGKKYKFDINLSKNAGNCPACGKGAYANQLHAKLCGVTNKQAYSDLWKRYKGLSSELKAKIDIPMVILPESEIAPLWLRDKIYKEFLSRLTISDKHRENLHKRGLSDDAIRNLMYKDVPTEEMDISDVIKTARMDEKVDKYFKKHDVRIAGFYDLMTAPKTVANKSGILAPIIVKNPHHTDDWITQKWDEDENLISGFQIRFDDVEPRKYIDENGKEQITKPNRYMPFYSHQKETGCRFTGYESVHMRLPDSVFDTDAMLFERPKVDTVIMTEGVIKSDVASFLSKDTPFIGILGVNNQRHLIDACKLLKQRYGTKKIILAFDQDKEDNWRVLDALEKAKNKIKACGLEVGDCDWHEEYVKYGGKDGNAKGIDDVLLCRVKEGRIKL